MSKVNFYKDLPYLEEFKDITNDKLFRDVPVDWYVLVSDIKGSTLAVEQGKYKEVNFIGACAITAVLNIDKSTDFPFVFGGDGATILIPPEYVDVASDALRDVQKFAEQEFGMYIRIGAVPVIELLRQRYQIKICKLKVSDNYFQSVFIGGGLDQAEYLVKNMTKYKIRKKKTRYKANFRGLECIWQDIPTKKEEVVSLLVKATSLSKSHTKIYTDLMDEIYDIYGSKEERFPVDKRNIKIKSNIKKIQMESAIEAYENGTKKKRIFYRKLVSHFFAYIRDKFDDGLSALTFNAYRKTVIHSIDSEKFDDMLRMVIAGSKQQRHRLIGYLEEKYQHGELAYGIHTTKSVQMTCLIFERRGKEVHFIDGSNAGYTTAAKEFKNRVKWQEIYMQTT